MTVKQAIFKLRNTAGWWEGDPNAERVLEEFRGDQLRETWDLHDKIVDGQTNEIHNHLMTIATLQAENRRIRAQLHTIVSDETFPRTSLYDEITMARLRERLQAEVARAVDAEARLKAVAAALSFDPTEEATPTVEQCVTTLSKALQADPSFAVSWQSNIAMPILDGCKRRSVAMDHATANQLADDLMLHLFGVKRTDKSL